MDKYPEILSETKQLELIRNINLIIKKLKDIKETLINKHTGLFDGLEEIIEFLNKNLEHNFVQMKAVNQDHKIEALRKVSPSGNMIR